MSKEKVVHVAVVGVSGLESSGGARPVGVGKSALCNRFVRPTADDYKPDAHKSVVSQYDFKNHVINSDQFLYWGMITKPGDGGCDIVFSVIEQTEFLDNRSFAPLEGKDKQPYYKRCGVTKLTSPEKLMYIDSYHQIGDEAGYERKVLPKGKFNVDGYLMVFDINKETQGRPIKNQIEFLDKVYKVIAKTKKPIVVVATKCDKADDEYWNEARAYATKLNTSFVETSAHLGLNVDLAFITLAQLIDKSYGTPNVVMYTEAFRIQKVFLDRIVDAYQKVLEKDVTTYHTLWLTRSKEYQKGHGNQAYMAYVKHLGAKSAKMLFEKRRKMLKDELIEKRRQTFLSTLLKVLEKVFPDVNDLGESWEACRGILTEHHEFEQWFVVMSEEWQNSPYLEKDDIRIPYDFLDTNHEECLEVFTGFVKKFMDAEKAEENLEGNAPDD